MCKTSDDGMMTVCSHCGCIIRDGELDDKGRPSHGTCPDCIRSYYPEYADEVLDDDGFEKAADAVSGYGGVN